ncbi:unnamed protein product [Lactuca saligna]|uniref:Uncharacterized protein n=1 Tax=Lactuca saligna TaxID=75948 RepID=A0AA36A0V1_LACSI|nr:unnamed protein product [Lactuca saligna]
MSLVNNSVETVNAAATAIVSAESRVQPTSVQKRRWSSCWSLYWCFGSYKQSKQISHALLAPESSTTSNPTAPSTIQNTNTTNTVVFPFIAPPSSPASFLQSDPPSASYSPVGLLSFKSQGVASSIFTIGPYAYETQLVSPPVFSTYTTEPSTASFTPPPESVQITTPSSPEVPFAQLLTSSLARARKQNQKFPFSQYEFQPYNNTKKLGSRLSSGSLTPNGWGSRLGSGSLTPNGLGSRLGSGSLTPNGGEMSQISEVASLANSATNSPKGETLVDHRVSFDLTHLDLVNNLESSRTSSGHRDFNFDNMNPGVGVALGSEKNWTFFPMLQTPVKPS